MLDGVGTYLVVAGGSGTGEPSGAASQSRRPWRRLVKSACLVARRRRRIRLSVHCAE